MHEINKTYQWEPQKFDEEFATAALSNIMELIKFKKLNERAILAKVGIQQGCDHPSEAVQHRQMAQITDPEFAHKAYQYFCTRCEQVVFPFQFRTLP